MARHFCWAAAAVWWICGVCAADPPATHWGEPKDGLSLGVRVDTDRLSAGFHVFLRNTGKQTAYVVRAACELGEPYVSKTRLHTVVRQVRWLEQPVSIRLLERSGSLFWEGGPDHAGPHIQRLHAFVFVAPPSVSKLAPGEILDCGFQVRPRWPQIARLREPAVQCGLRVRRFSEPPKAASDVTGRLPVLLTSPIVGIPDPPTAATSGCDAAYDFYARFFSRLTERPDASGLDVLIAMAKGREPQAPATDGKPSPARDLALWALSRTGRPEAVDALMGVCKDRDDPLRGAATLYLGRAKDRRAVPLLATLCTDPDKVVRAHAAAGLGQLGAAEHVGVLAKLVESDPFPSARENAARALGQIGGEVALAALHAALADPHYNVRYNVVLALRRIDDRRSIAPLADFLDRAKRPEDSIAIDEAAATIDVIAGRAFKGDVKAIREWRSTSLKPKTDTREQP